MLQRTNTALVVDFDSLPDEAFIRLKPIVVPVTGMSPATVWRKINEGSFPAPIKISTNITAWRVGDVRRWLADPMGWAQ